MQKPIESLEVGTVIDHVRAGRGTVVEVWYSSSEWKARAVFDGGTYTLYPENNRHIEVVA